MSIFLHSVAAKVDYCEQQNSSRTPAPNAAKFTHSRNIDPLCKRSQLVEILKLHLCRFKNTEYVLNLVLFQIEKHPLLKMFSCEVVRDPRILASERKETITILRQTLTPLDIVLCYESEIFALIMAGHRIPNNLIVEDLRARVAHLGSVSGFGASVVKGQSECSAEELLLTAETRLADSRKRYATHDHALW